MDLNISEMLRDLRLQKQKLDRAIAALESLAETETAKTRATPGKHRRGRTWMGSKERKEVSARMKRYWASRRSHPPEKGSN
ncbi:MAG: hypothetical protein JO336_22170 [Acidobacteriia bacterium]|nr:hypothetical protein [Terriglobia bacterium]